MSMHNPNMYAKYIAFQKQDALHYLQKFGSKMKWKKNASVIDLGCGDGFVTTSILKPQLPNDFKQLVGVDVSKEMVEYATKKYGNERIRFGLMDIGGEVPKDLKGAFDHAFSSYALQFVPNQEKAFSNIYDVLKGGGSCLLLFMASFSLFDTFVTLAKREKWQPYSKALDCIVPRYHAMKNPDAEVTRIMKKSGFKDIYVESQVESNKSSFEYEALDSLLKMVESANLLHLLPEVEGEFMKEFSEVLIDLKGVEPVKGKSTIRLNYTPIIAYGMKSAD